MSAIDSLAEGRRVVIRAYTPADAEEFTTRARESRGVHSPWLFPPEDPRAYATYAGRLIDDPTKAGFLVCEREREREGDGDGEREPDRDGGRDREAGGSGAGGGIAGFININNIVRGGFCCGALGYGAFAHAVGRGLMSEGLALVLRYAFGPLGLHRLEANIQPGNKGSLALVRRAGFRLEGFSPDFLFIDGAWRDHERWAITAGMPVGQVIDS
ncbi:GNAT family N-acetyltransferase [Streptomyces sp. NPDC057963]|uniref:GNAT family N-acetyltransferase n=1 Tax=Streptomyces sp. NPDC057963 TaxID=3346290 RepID=UPI0036ED0FA4